MKATVRTLVIGGWKQNRKIKNFSDMGVDFHILNPYVATINHGDQPMTHAQALKTLVRFGTKVPLGTRWTLVIIYCNAR
jgi:hypothetical protein